MENIAFFGKFNSGKSSLVNSIFGRRVVLEKPIPTHTPPVALRYGEKFELQAVNPQKKQLYKGDSWSKIEEICTTNTVEVVIVTIPHTYLKYGLMVWDTPGIDDLKQEYGDAAKKFVAAKKTSIDLAYYLVSNTALTKSDLDFVDYLKSNGIRTIVLFSKADRNTDDEVKKVIIEFEKLLLSTFNQKIEVQAVSPRQIWNDSISKYFVQVFELNVIEQELEKIYDMINIMKNTTSEFLDATKSLKSVDHNIQATGEKINNSIIALAKDLQQKLIFLSTDMNQNNSKLSTLIGSVTPIV